MTAGIRTTAFGRRSKHDCLAGARWNDEDFERLRFSCEHHTHRTHHEDPVVAACWDADRLELGRVEIEPDPDYFNTVPAIDLVRSGDLQELESLPLRGR